MIGLTAFIALAAAAPAITPTTLPPVEQCRGDQGFDRFRASLEDAITRKDPAALKRLAASDIIANFGGGSSWEAFAQQWGLENPKSSALWKEMAGAIALGCAHTPDGGRVFPGLFEAMGDDADPFELVVARPGTPLRSKPDIGAAMIAKLDWSSAIVVNTEAPEGWAKIQLLRGGPLGWVETGAIISPLGYRLVAQLQGDRWVITAFVAGD